MKILCVCGLGQGTSLILRMNVETVLSEMGIVADVDNTDVSSATSERADYIITSNELAQSLEDHAGKILIVNNYFDLNEIKQVLSACIN
ncbi:PTS sugar transporter subunit IIB [Niallia taxi]|uniref:PTS sugar transporter subunit IIB n=1 Tax=Niallia taxi TaxID=2499688 RepID=A0A3S2X169_9BACI|nr:PTS sugar transporter subunit IIB [Niallia taxi]MCM3213903.1 PTS sugar transporter subunit IIB [Niallia taxi]MDK8642021.1 PTS sugar transporter subunit IIB [Niallia taxi]RVT59838.1 PTS sugar transporter subunit IIB [Niallia taxi]